MANPVFSNPQYKYDEATQLHHVTITVDGDSTNTTTGIGDTKEQAKRNACAKYMHDNEIDYLGIPKDTPNEPLR